MRMKMEDISKTSAGQVHFWPESTVLGAQKQKRMIGCDCVKPYKGGFNTGPLLAHIQIAQLS